MIYSQICILFVVVAAAISGLTIFWKRRRQRQAAHAALIKSDTADQRYVFVYVAGSEGLKRLREDLGTQEGWWKVGVVGARGGNPQELLANRMRMLKGYGAFVRTASGLIEEPGFDAWRVQKLARPASIRPRREICVLPDCIAVGLPAHMPFGRFDALLRNALSDRSLLHHLGGARSTVCGARYTRVNGRYVLQTEIVRLRPRKSGDIEHLVSLIAAIIDCARGEAGADVKGYGEEGFFRAASPPASIAKRRPRLRSLARSAKVSS